MLIKTYFNRCKYIFTTFSKPKYKLSAIRAWPIETSAKLGMFCLKNLIFSKLKSCPALIPKPNLFAKTAASVYGFIASLFPK